MSFIKTDDNVKLFYESIGKGEPIILVHEFAGDYRSCLLYTSDAADD